jgi:hypothetical protein
VTELSNFICSTSAQQRKAMERDGRWCRLASFSVLSRTSSVVLSPLAGVQLSTSAAERISVLLFEPISAEYA